MDTTKKTPGALDESMSASDTLMASTVIAPASSTSLRDKIGAEQDAFAGDRLIRETAAQMQTGSSNLGVADVANGATAVTRLTSLSISGAYDSAGGETGLVGNGATIDDVRPLIRGEGGEPLTRIQLFSDGKFVGNAVVDQLGFWQIKVTTLNALEPGEHVFTVVDAAGNVSEPFTLIVEIPESSRPVIATVSDNVGVPGEIANGGTTDDSSQTFQGRGVPGSQLFLYDDHELIGSTIVGADGCYSFEADRPLAPGVHSLTVFIDGIPSHPFTLTVEIAEAPKPVIESAFDNFGVAGDIANGGTTDDSTPILRGQGQPLSQVKVYENGNFLGYAGIDGSGNWAFNVNPPLAKGEHVFTVVSAGVTSDPFTLNVGTPDTAKPVIESVFDDYGVVGEVGNGGTTDDTRPTLSGQGEPFSRVKASENGQVLGYANVDPNGNWTFSVMQALAIGEHVFTVEGAGVSSDPFTLIVGAADSVMPVIDAVIDNIGGTSVIVSGGTTDDARPTFHGRAEPSTFISVYDNGKLVGQAEVEPDGSWSFSNHDKRLGEGEHVFTFVGAGVTSEPFVLNVSDAPETQKPMIDSAYDHAGVETGSVDSGATIDDQRPVFSGRGEPDALLWIYDNYQLVDTVIVDAQGNWTFQPENLNALAPGLHVYTVYSDGVYSDPFVLNVVDANAPMDVRETQMPMTDDLPLLSELLQPAGELFTGDADIPPVGGSEFELSAIEFDASLSAVAPSTDLAGGVVVAVTPVETVELWQPHP